MENIFTKIKFYYKSDYDMLEKAFKFAESAHKSQRRVSGEPYISHPIQVADLLINLGMDCDTIAAAFLHDVLEDTLTAPEVITQEFSESITELVKGVTKLDKLKFSSREQSQAENFRKLFFAMAKDVRVIIIKLADRVHNMRTIGYLPFEKQQVIANETLDIYAPLASRLGLSYLKCELEDLSLKCLHPVVYETLVAEVNMKRAERQAQVESLIAEIKGLIGEMGIEGEVSGRPKHFYSIYKKMVNQNKSFSEIFDLTAIRVIVDSVDHCYEVLGRLHTKWKPIPGRLKDYIAVPKPNNYQSLHTTVMTQYGAPFEIQIRTADMHRIAEFGIAAHWKYKENLYKKDTDFDSKVNWLRQTLDMQKDFAEDPREFYKTFQIDLYTNQIFTFTPKGDVIVLPKGATPVDFAYKVHAEVGNRCVGAKINGRMLPLDTRLKTGEYVEILTNKKSKPKRDWLNFVVSGSAKSRIRAYLRKEDEALAKSEPVKPKEGTTPKHRLEVIITAADGKGLLAGITGAISAQKLSIKAINAVEKGKQAVITVDIEMRKGADQDGLLRQLKQVKGVKTVFAPKK